MKIQEQAASRKSYAPSRRLCAGGQDGAACGARGPTNAAADGTKMERALIRLYLVRGHSMEPSHRSGQLLFVGPYGA